jgi:methyl-accepting chemotaxis protein
MVRANAENAGEAASLAQNSSRIAKDGESEVQNLIGAISEINHSSKKIEEIITVIDDIAFQTNLLALNAAVEAARAGEQGKGFAVVAEAVRNLAQRSGTAAKEITSLIRDNVDKIDRGTKIADRSGQVLQSILASVRKVADLNNEIAAASKEQSSGLSQISKAMNEIDQATQRNAAASEEVASSSEEMNAQATTLQAMVHDLSDVITGSSAGVTPPPAPRPSTPSKVKRPGNVMELKRPPARSANRTATPAQTAMKAKSHAESVIPFGDDDDEPPARISSTAGF